MVTLTTPLLYMQKISLLRWTLLISEACLTLIKLVNVTQALVKHAVLCAKHSDSTGLQKRLFSVSI